MEPPSDARSRAGSTLGLTGFLVRSLGSEGEASARVIGTYGLRSMVHEVRSAVLDPLPLERQPKSKPFTPLLSCVAMVRLLTDNRPNPAGRLPKTDHVLTRGTR